MFEWGPGTPKLWLFARHGRSERVAFGFMCDRCQNFHPVYLFENFEKAAEFKSQLDDSFDKLKRDEMPPLPNDYNGVNEAKRILGLNNQMFCSS